MSYFIQRRTSCLFVCIFWGYIHTIYRCCDKTPQGYTAVVQQLESRLYLHNRTYCVTSSCVVRCVIYYWAHVFAAQRCDVMRGAGFTFTFTTEVRAVFDQNAGALNCVWNWRQSILNIPWNLKFQPARGWTGHLASSYTVLVGRCLMWAGQQV